MLSVEEKIWQLDEVVSTAFGSWQIYVTAYNKFNDWPEKRREHPAFSGYETIRNLLSHSLIVACDALLDSGKQSYSFHHAMNDPELKITSEATAEYQACLKFTKKIGIYRNNVSAHINDRKTQAEWAQHANIKNGEFDIFIRSARATITELGKANINTNFVPSSKSPFAYEFNEFCCFMAIDQPHRQ